MSAMRSKTKSEVGLWLGAGGQNSMMQWNCYKHPILRGPGELIGPKLLQEPGTYCGGHGWVVVLRYQEKS